MLLGSKILAISDIRRYTIDYSEFLFKGITLATVTATVTTPYVKTTVGSATLDDAKRKVYLFLIAGTVVENLTVQLEITDSLGQQINDTINFGVVEP